MERDNSAVVGFFNSSLKWNSDTVFCHKRLEREDQNGEMALWKLVFQPGFGTVSQSCPGQLPKPL